MAFKVGQVVAFKAYGSRRFPHAIQYHRVTNVVGKGQYAQIYVEGSQSDNPHAFFLAGNLRKLHKRERGQ